MSNNVSQMMRSSLRNDVGLSDGLLMGRPIRKAWGSPGMQPRKKVQELPSSWNLKNSNVDPSQSTPKTGIKDGETCEFLQLQAASSSSVKIKYKSLDVERPTVTFGDDLGNGM